MTQIKGNILKLTGSKNYGFAIGVCKSQFVENVRVLICEISQKNLRTFNLIPDLLNDAESTDAIAQTLLAKESADSPQLLEIH